MTNAATQCPVCHRPHNFGKCHKCLEAGWLVKYSPDEAKAALAIARPGGGKLAFQTSGQRSRHRNACGPGPRFDKAYSPGPDEGLW